MNPGAVSLPTRWALVSALSAALFGLLALLVTARHGTPWALDRSLYLWSVRHRPPVLLAVARAITATGTGPVPYLCAVTAGLVVGVGVGRGVWGRLSPVAGALGFLLLVQGMRYAVLFAVSRPRPPAGGWATHAHGFAFPSGHTSTSATAAGLLAWALWRTATPAAARAGWCVLACWAVAVGLTRGYLGVHWPSDVLGGWLYALTWLAAAAAWAARVYRTDRPAPPGPRSSTVP
ncbi:phosphatase PAP2 family protein [Streptomyces goshikiensis]|uniref:phosphatase PAP2 family protein n=1 Tax=Streptomyces goshikiensis TaxID=1942 RepID=UPI00369FBBD5